MRTLKNISVSILTLLVFNTYAAEPTEEFRAVWLTTFAGLDWPNSFDPEEQQRSLLTILDRLHRSNFNAIIFQARSRGDAFYKSSFEPWARELTGQTGKDPGWDPLAFLIKHAHQRGIEVHAWFNVYKVWGGLPIPYDIDPPHMLEQNPDWAQIYGNEWWLDPGIPGVNTHLLKVALDLVERYPVDGIHFDHIRYPGRDFDDARTYRRLGGGRDIHDWRRDNITNFVRDFYSYATAIRPELKIGSAPMGVYKSVPGFSGWTGYVDYYQDAEKWLREEIHDYIVPQVYWNIARNPKFDIIMHDWNRRAHGRHIYSGIGIFQQDILREMYLQISITRALGIPGQVFFRYNHLNNPVDLANSYKYQADIPTMPWKQNRHRHIKEQIIKNESVYADTGILPTWLPAHLRFAIHDNNRNSLLVPIDDKSNSPQRFIIYRSDTYPVDTNNPEHLLAVLPATTDSFNNELTNPASSGYTYLVSVLNGRDEEKQFGGLDLVDDVARMLNREIIFPLVADPVRSDTYYLGLYVPRGSSTSVWITDEITGGRYYLVEGFLDEGIHIIPVQKYLLQPYFRCTVMTGNRITERLLKLSDR